MAEIPSASRPQSITFERAATYYDATRGFPAGQEVPVAALIAQVGNLNAQSRVLEVGIGTGRIALPLSAHVGTIYGADLARPMMQRLITKRTVERIFLAEGDARLLPFPSNTFDAVVIVHVLHLIPDWERAVAEIARVLRPGGLFLIGGGNSQGKEYPFDALWEVWRGAVPPTQGEHIGLRGPFAGQAERLGWAAAAPAMTYTYSIHESPQEFYARMEQRMWSRTWSLSEDELAAGLAAVRTAIADRFGDPTQPIELPLTFEIQAFAPPQKY